MLTGCQRPIALQSHLDISLNMVGIKIKVSTIGVAFDVKLPRVIDLRTGTRHSIISAMIQSNCGVSYPKS